MIEWAEDGVNLIVFKFKSTELIGKLRCHVHGDCRLQLVLGLACGRFMNVVEEALDSNTPAFSRRPASLKRLSWLRKTLTLSFLGRRRKLSCW